MNKTSSADPSQVCTYRSRQTIQAVQWTGENFEEIKAAIGGFRKLYVENNELCAERGGWVNRIKPGFFICIEIVSGAHPFCGLSFLTEDEFHEHYEPVTI